jgi:hypothetical protein
MWKVVAIVFITVVGEAKVAVVDVLVALVVSILNISALLVAIILPVISI